MSAIYDVAADSTDHVYMVGFYRGVLKTNNASASSRGLRDMLIAKWSLKHKRLVWAMDTKTPGRESAYSIQLGPKKNMHIAGSFTMTMKLGKQTLVRKGGQDAFVAKINQSTKKFVWANAISGPKEDAIIGVVVDQKGATYVAGYFEKETTISQKKLVSGGGKDTFVAKFSPKGSLVWSKLIGGRGDDCASSIALDSSGNLYLTGSFEKQLKVGSFSLNSKGKSDVFLAKMSNKGTFLWAKQAGGVGEDIGKSLAVTPKGTIYVVGDFTKQISFPGHTLKTTYKSDVFVAKVRTNGSFEWVRK
jgi:hypothetical protein